MDEIGKDVQNEYLKSYPKEHLPQPTIYDGPEILKVSYILDRNPICTHSEHPLEVEMGNEQQKEKSYYSRNKYHHFEDYFEAWKSEKDKLEKKNQDFSGEFASIKVPDPKYSEKEKVEIFRLLGKKEGSKTATELLKKFNPMPRYTLDDLEDNRHSLNRKLMNNLYLIVKDKVSKKWKFPETIRKNPETLRLAIENKLLHDFNEKVYGKFLAHHPLCHLELSKDEKVFFYHSIYIQGKITSEDVKKNYLDYQWITRQEIFDYEFEYENGKQMFFDILDDGFELF